MSLRTDLRPALTASWLAVSAAGMAAVAAPFLIPSGLLYGLFSECPKQAAGSSCPLCGMTTAWILIAGGDWSGALHANRGSIALWLVALVNFAAALSYTIMYLRRRYRFGGKNACNCSP